MFSISMHMYPERELIKSKQILWQPLQSHTVQLYCHSYYIHCDYLLMTRTTNMVGVYSFFKKKKEKIKTMNKLQETNKWEVL